MAADEAVGTILQPKDEDGVQCVDGRWGHGGVGSDVGCGTVGATTSNKSRQSDAGRLPYVGQHISKSEAASAAARALVYRCTALQTHAILTLFCSKPAAATMMPSVSHGLGANVFSAMGKKEGVTPCCTALMPPTRCHLPFCWRDLQPRWADGLVVVPAHEAVIAHPWLGRRHKVVAGRTAALVGQVHSEPLGVAERHQLQLNEVGSQGTPARQHNMRGHTGTD